MRMSRFVFSMFSAHGSWNASKRWSSFLQIAERGSETGSGEVKAGGQPFPDPENDVIHFVGWIDTRKLSPGRYTLLAVLPNDQERTRPELTGEFEVLSR